MFDVEIILTKINLNHKCIKFFAWLFFAQEKYVLMCGDYKCYTAC